jgi:hypothetical protein
MLKKFLEATVPAEKERMITHGQKGLEAYRDHFQVRDNTKTKIPSFFKSELDNDGYEYLEGTYEYPKYIEDLRPFVMRQRGKDILKATHKVKPGEYRIIISLKNNSCYYTHIDNYIHGHVVNYMMALGEIEMKQENAHYGFTEKMNVAKHIVGFELTKDKEMWFSESYDLRVLNNLIAQEKRDGVMHYVNKDFLDKCYSILKQYFNFDDFYLGCLYEDGAEKYSPN